MLVTRLPFFIWGIMNIGIKKTVEVEAKTIKICGKVSDMFNASILDQDRQRICEYEGYVPGGFGIGSDDYIEFELDLETGQILNYHKPSVDDLKRFINKANGHEED